jgi:selenocysteine-specific elongation factor
LPIDRSFTIRGFGAVVTGTLVAGSITEGEELELLPAGNRVRVRGLQVHNASVKHAVAGQRTAVNIGGIESSSIARGMMLAPSGHLRPTQIVDAAVQLLPDAPRGLRSRQRLRIHLGAAEVLARVRVLEETGEIKPGAKGFAQLRFEAPVVAALGDRFIVRSYSPQVTVGGGEVLDSFALKHRTRDLNGIRTALQKLQDGNPREQLSQFVVNAGRSGLNEADLAARTAWSREVITGLSAEASANGGLIRIENILIGGEHYQELKNQVIEQVTAHHRQEPLSRGLSKEILREQLFGATTPEVFRALIAQLEGEGLVVGDKEVVRLREHTRELSDKDTSLRNSLEELYCEAALAPPALNDALARAGLNHDAQHARKILQLLLDAGVLVRVHGDMIFHQEALRDLEDRLRAYAGSRSDRSIDVPGFKELTGVSRKYAIPLLEHFDRRRVTRRDGDKRIILEK